ncbi:NAD kinase [Porphyromonas circumdentaria]|uniref:NAD kinase n=1 Tax=Porphyromonas circumdentaria TaxID=29524 RepID=A0A1T4NQC9_9PORP|nr:NAD kinase [Porphyromonas circumdentaria]MBB6276165.1 NAD+ kinase [Porphyromonas circumdentaria]MDO4721659.1 NAD kinase [Porphyromonas circumdentaria]SJZ81399.1 NAD+ kinase [Porphyromonas circumdentaria]
MKRIALFGTIAKAETLPDFLFFLSRLLDLGAHISVEEEFLISLKKRSLLGSFDLSLLDEESLSKASLIISFGGDGTFLRTVHKVEHLTTPILAINGGHLGFLTDIDASEALSYIDRLLANDYRIEERSILSVEVEGRFLGYAFNEVAIQRRETGSMITVETHINEDYLADYAADGLIVAPPSGSTAYSLSVNGPIVAPHCPVILLTPVAPHSLSMRPVVIPDNAIINLKVHSRSSSFTIAVDGRFSVFPSGVPIVIRQATHKVSIIRLGTHSFYETLRTKLMWGKNPR